MASGRGPKATGTLGYDADQIRIQPHEASSCQQTMRADAHA